MEYNKNNKTVLEVLLEDIEGLEKMQNYMMSDDLITYGDLMTEIRFDHFSGCEYILPVLLLSSVDPVIDRTVKRIFIKLYSDRMRQAGAPETVDMVRDILDEEHRRWEVRQKRMGLLERRESSKLV